MKIEKVCTETYSFEQGDMFIFKQDVGFYNKGDFIILIEKEHGESWRVHNNETLLVFSRRAGWSESNLTELIKSEAINYIGIVEVKDSINNS